MKFKLWIMVGVLPALLAACATSQIAKLDNERPLDAREAAHQLAAFADGKRKMEPSASERFDIVVVGGICAPKSGVKFAVTACVNEKPCNGHGLRMPDGSVACACYTWRGGCDEASFCHDRNRTCNKLPADLYHVQ